MIKSINPINTKNNYFNSQRNKRQNFKGVGETLTTVLQVANTHPMVNVTIVDLISAIIPRTLIDLFTAGPAASMESLRRESSGLVVNCLTPSFVVLGVAKALNNFQMKGYEGIDMASSWAGQDTIETFTRGYSRALKGANSGNTDSVTKRFIKSMISKFEGLDGTKAVKYADNMEHANFKEAINIVETLIDSPVNKKADNAMLKKAQSLMAEVTKATDSLSYADGRAKASLADLLRDMVDLGRKFKNPKVAKNLKGFADSAVKFVNRKSVLGLALVMPLAMSMQFINRAITRKKYNQKGAPIYKDFGKGGDAREMTSQEKKKFFRNKVLAGGVMLGLAVASMMKKPNMKMFQFKGIFPSIDQARWIATATFISRLFASEDQNELRESLSRDVVTFLGMYFLGDYVAKGVATIAEKVKPDMKMLNRFVETKDTDSILKKAWNWVKNVELKSVDEVSTTAAKNMRSVCQAANIGFSLLLLGVIVPLWNRKVTQKKEQAKKEQAALNNVSSNVPFTQMSSKKPQVFNKF